MKAILLLGWTIGFYTQLSLPVGAVLIPNIIGGASGAVLLLMHSNRINRRDVIAILSLLILSAFLSLLTATALEAPRTRVIAFLQLAYAIVSSYGAYLYITSLNKDSVQRAILLFVCGLLTLSFLEVLTPFRGVVDSFTESAYNLSAQEQLNRDVNIAGFLRPRLFTSEPSHLAKALSVLTICYVAVRPGFRVSVISVVLTILSLAIVRSPIPLLVFPILWVVYTFGAREPSFVLRQNHIYFNSIFVGAIVAVSLLYIMANILDDRIAAVQSGDDLSAIIRLFSGIEVGFRVASEYPFFGVGLGAHEVAREIIIDTMLDYGLPADIVYRDWESSLNNALGSTMLYFGFVGSVLFLLFLLRLMKNFTGGDVLIPFVFILLLSFTMGSIYSPRFFNYLFLVMACVALSKTVPVRSRGARQSKAFQGQRTANTRSRTHSRAWSSGRSNKSLLS